jgi:hypothetical protein
MGNSALDTHGEKYRTQKNSMEAVGLRKLTAKSTKSHHNNQVKTKYFEYNTVCFYYYKENAGS